MAVHLFDTAVSSPAPLAAAALAQRTGWLQLPEDETDHKFRGDAVLVNDRLAVVLRRGAGGAEVYSPDAQGWTLRAVLAPDGDAPDSALTSVTIIDNTPSEVSVDAAFASPGGNACSLRFGLAMGQMFVKTEPQANVAGLSVAAPCRFAVLPDFFADDIVIDAAELPVAAAELPSENFLLHLLPGRDAVVMTVASQRDRDARITLSGEGAQRQIDKSVMYYGSQGQDLGGGARRPRRLASARRARRGSRADRSAGLDGAVSRAVACRLAADRPADRQLGNGRRAAQRRVHQARLVRQSGDAARHPPTLDDGVRPVRVPVLARSRGTGVLAAAEEAGTVRRAGRDLSDQPGPDHSAGPVHRGGRGAGHIGRRPLRVHPGRRRPGATRKGRATCATRDALKAIYAAREQKQRRAEIETILDEVVLFVTHIRSRIDQYVGFGHELLAYLDQQKHAHPELAEFLADMESATKAIDAAFEKRQANIRTPQYVIDLTDEFRKTLLDNEGDDALQRCTKITEAIVVVGGNQDELVGECRNAVKILRQRAGLAMAQQPQAAEIAKEIRDRTQKVLRQAASYEAPRH